ncbi:unnamed protein product [Eruca vesicaria subsp. sativa]|uniref:Remorin C-terminal domain-containing protein n=1 Tax=Eruca vesicaria subsp. sativa TaxID=29727 RepID=A0ABC8L676_ERUVS|nr:unnamed protein product [Eruca vesicaria subsp. sativa]
MGPAVELWKETEMGKAKTKYEKLMLKITLWEDKRTKNAKRKLHRTEVPLPFFKLSRFPKLDSCIITRLINAMNVQRGVEKTKLKAMQRYTEDNERIESIVASARTHAYESQMKEELKVKEKANFMRITGRSPSTCL